MIRFLLFVAILKASIADEVRVTSRQGMTCTKNRCTAQGDVKIQNSSITITSDKAELTLDANDSIKDTKIKSIRCYGNVYVVSRKGEKVFGHNMTYIPKAQKISFTNGVRLIFENDKLFQAQQATAFISNESNSLSRFKARGNIILSTENEIVQSDTCTYDQRSRKVELQDNIISDNQDGRLIGRVATYDLKSEKLHVIGPQDRVTGFVWVENKVPN